MLTSYRKAINLAIQEEIRQNKNVFLLGEEVGSFNGAYKVSENLLSTFSKRFIIDTPISEEAFTSLAIGSAMSGLRPIVEYMTWSFSFVAFDQIINNAANIRYMSGGSIKIPIVFRGPANGGVNVGSTHSHNPSNIYSSIPGIKIVYPSNPYDAKGLLKSSIRDNDPVCFLENTVLYNFYHNIPNKEYIIPLGCANIKKWGNHITFITYGLGVHIALRLSKILKYFYNLNIEVIDLRTLRPLDEITLLKSAKKTRRVIIIEENRPFCSISSQIADLIESKLFTYIEKPILKICSLDAPSIYSMPLEKYQILNIKRILKYSLKLFLN